MTNRPVQKGFYQKMLVSDRYKLVAYMGEMYGELYDMANDPNQYENLWDSPRHREQKQLMLGNICAASGADRKKTAKAGIEELLATMTARMRSEEPLQERTSYS
jgi:hypothetical protein